MKTAVLVKNQNAIIICFIAYKHINLLHDLIHINQDKLYSVMLFWNTVHNGIIPWAVYMHMHTPLQHMWLMQRQRGEPLQADTSLPHPPCPTPSQLCWGAGRQAWERCYQPMVTPYGTLKLTMHAAGVASWMLVYVSSQPGDGLPAPRSRGTWSWL